MHRFVLGLLVLGLAAGITALALTREEKSALRELADARARVVWVEDHSEGQKDVFAREGHLRLMGYDSDDGRGPRPLREGLGNFAKPMIVVGGEQVVYSDRHARQGFILNWGGENHRKLVDGFILETWRDPDDGAEWVYYQAGGDGNRASREAPIRRMRLDAPEVDELVWDGSPVDVDNFQLSGDGSVASLLFPFPRGGVLDLVNGKLIDVAEGCWVSMSPDDRRLFWIFDLPHRNLTIHPVDGGEPWSVAIDGAKGMEGFEVYHPRWSNDPALFVVTGPYREGKGPNRIRAGGAAVDVWVGRFADDLRSVDGWVKISRNARGDFYPDLWVAGS